MMVEARTSTRPSTIALNQHPFSVQPATLKVAAGKRLAVLITVEPLATTLTAVLVGADEDVVRAACHANPITQSCTKRTVILSSLEEKQHYGAGHSQRVSGAASGAQGGGTTIAGDIGVASSPIHLSCGSGSGAGR